MNTSSNTIANGLNNYLEQQKLNDNQQTDRPFVRIIEQPARAALRFRYQCEGLRILFFFLKNTKTSIKVFIKI